MGFAEKLAKASHVIEKAKDEIDAIIHTEKTDTTETHGRNKDTGSGEDKIEAIVHTEKTDTTETHGRNKDIDKDTPINEVKAPNLLERAKEEVDAIVETIHPRDTPINDVKAPNLLERAKEEVDAVVETIHSKKMTGCCEQSKKEDGGFFSFIGKLFERFCSPNTKKD